MRYMVNNGKGGGWWLVAVLFLAGCQGAHARGENRVRVIEGNLPSGGRVVHAMNLRAGELYSASVIGLLTDENVRTLTLGISPRLAVYDRAGRLVAHADASDLLTFETLFYAPHSDTYWFVVTNPSFSGGRYSVTLSATAPLSYGRSGSAGRPSSSRWLDSAAACHHRTTEQQARFAMELERHSALSRKRIFNENMEAYLAPGGGLDSGAPAPYDVD